MSATEDAGVAPAAGRPEAGGDRLGRLGRLMTPRLRRVDLSVAVLLGVLGFAAVVQVRATQEDGPLANARQEDLVQILDELANRNDRLRAEVSALERTRADLSSGTGTTEAALVETRRCGWWPRPPSWTPSRAGSRSTACC